MNRKILALLLLAAAHANAANLYFATEPVEASDYFNNPDYQRFAETCDYQVNIQTDVRKAKTNRPKIDAQLNHDAPKPEELKKFIIDSIKEFYEEGSDKESLCSASHNYETGYTPDYLGHHGALEQFRVSVSAYTGGAHGISGTTYYVFDENDHRLTLADLLQGDKSALYPLLDAAYKVETDTDPAAKDLEDYEREYVKNLHEADNFYFSADGVVFSYVPYAVASYAARQVELTLPYSKLRGIIKDAYLPQ